MPREFVGLGVLAVLGALLYVVLRSPPTLPARAEEPIVVVTPPPRPAPPAPREEPPVEPPPPSVVADTSSLPSPQGLRGGRRGRSSSGTHETEEEGGSIATPPREVAAFYERELSARGLSPRRWEQPGLIVVEGEGPLRTEVAELRLRSDGGTEVARRSTRWRVTAARAPTPSSSSLSRSRELAGDLALPRGAVCTGGGHGSSDDRHTRDVSCVVEHAAGAASFYEATWQSDGFDVRRTLMRAGTATREVVVGWRGGRRNSAVVVTVDGAAHATLHVGTVQQPIGGRPVLP